MEMVERSRSRAFLDQLSYTELLVPHGGDFALLAREHELAVALRGNGWAMQQAETEEQRLALAVRTKDLEARWGVVLDQMQELVPEYVALRRGEPARLAEIQALLQPPASEH